MFFAEDILSPVISTTESVMTTAEGRDHKVLDPARPLPPRKTDDNGHDEDKIPILEQPYHRAHSIALSILQSSFNHY